MFRVIKIKKLTKIGLTALVLCFTISAFAIAQNWMKQQASGEDMDGIQLPILMYHDILKDPKRQGTYTITPWEFEADMKYLSENGYQTVSCEDLVVFVEQGVPLPEKPVLITFDDGHFNNIFYAEPILEEYGFHAVMFVVGSYCEQAVLEGEENPNYSYVTWERIAQMSRGTVWEVQSHTWDMHSYTPRHGVLRMDGESDSAYAEALTSDFTQITNHLKITTGSSPIAFAYPFGYLDDMAEETLHELGYQVTVCSRDGISTIRQGDPNSLYQLKRMVRDSGNSLSNILGD